MAPAVRRGPRPLPSPAMLPRIAVLAAALLGLAACSGEEGAREPDVSTSAPVEQGPDPRLVPLLTQGPEGPTQEPRIGHASARRICSSADVGLLADAYGIEATQASEEVVAEEMAARLDAPDEVRDAVREGCLEGFPAPAECIAGWNAAGNADLRAATAGRPGAEVYVVGATHTPALDAVDACVLLVSPPGADPFATEGWQPAAVYVRTGGEWVGASSLIGQVANPTAVAVPTAQGFDSVVVVLPLEPAATVEADGSLVPRS